MKVRWILWFCGQIVLFVACLSLRGQDEKTIKINRNDLFFYEIRLQNIADSNLFDAITLSINLVRSRSKWYYIYFSNNHENKPLRVIEFNRNIKEKPFDILKKLPYLSENEFYYLKDSVKLLRYRGRNFIIDGVPKMRKIYSFFDTGRKVKYFSKFNFLLKSKTSIIINIDHDENGVYLNFYKPTKCKCVSTRLIQKKEILPIDRKKICPNTIL